MISVINVPNLMNLQSCGNCRKWHTAQCSDRKQGYRKNPCAHDWCAAYRKDHDKAIHKAITDIKGIVAVLDPAGYKQAEIWKAERERREHENREMDHHVKEGTGISQRG